MTETLTRTKTVHVVIAGRVQGVGFRSWTMHTARNLNISGWVRNCADGSVEALFSGADEAVDKMLKRCWDGPLIARVTSVNITPRTDSVDAGFLQRPTV